MAKPIIKIWECPVCVTRIPRPNIEDIKDHLRFEQIEVIEMMDEATNNSEEIDKEVKRLHVKL
jgi:hypothetical protein